MPAEVIDLLSSEPFEPLLTSPPQAPTVTHPRRDSFLRLSDVLDFSDVDEPTGAGASKRRRLTPPPSEHAAAPKPSPRRSPRIAKSRTSFDSSDPIVLSSSPGVRRSQNNYGVSRATTSAVAASKAKGKGKDKEPFDIFDELDDFDDSPARMPAATMQYSSKTTALLAELDNNRVKGPKVLGARSTTTIVKTTTKTKVSVPLSSIEDPSSQAAPHPTKRKGRLTTLEKAQRAKDKAQEKGAVAAAKAILRAEKAQAKQLEKDLVEVNKARDNKEKAVSDMVLRMPEGFFEKNIGRLTEEAMKLHNVEVEIDSGSAEPELTGVLRWKRKVRAQYDTDLGHWVPLGRMELREEMGHILCMLEAAEFVKMVQQEALMADSSSDGSIGINNHVSMLKRKWPTARPIYLIEGLEPFMRKVQNARNRRFKAAVHAQEQPAESSSQNKRKRKQKDDIDVDDNLVEDALLRLQVEYNCLIHHSAAAPDTAEWIGKFTLHVSTIPWKTTTNVAEASFCMESGQVKTGEDKEDTFVKMLQEMVRVTKPVAYGIVAQYPSVISLVHAFKRGGPLILQNLQKSNNADGSFSEKRIGEALSKRIYKVFTGTNPDSMDV